LKEKLFKAETKIKSSDHENEELREELE